MDDEDIEKAEALMNELVIPSEEHGRSFYAPAPPKASEAKAEAPEAAAPEAAAPVKKKPKGKSWAGLLNTGPKYAGRHKNDEDWRFFEKSIGKGWRLLEKKCMAGILIREVERHSTVQVRPLTVYKHHSSSPQNG